MLKKWNTVGRKIHYWGAMACAIPVLIMTLTGILLLLKQHSDWIQPGTMKGTAGAPSLAATTLYDIVQRIPEAQINTWDDIDRIDTRPSKGVIKVRARNQWEVQLDQQSGTILSSQRRRSGIIESLHDGSFFHDSVKLGVFFPAALLLFLLWATGLLLFLQRELAKRRSKRKRHASSLNTNATAFS